MLILKETRPSHDEKSIANTALLASVGRVPFQHHGRLLWRHQWCPVGSSQDWRGQRRQQEEGWWLPEGQQRRQWWRRPRTTAGQQRRLHQQRPSALTPHGSVVLLQPLDATDAISSPTAGLRGMAPWHPGRCSSGAHRLRPSSGVPTGSHVGPSGPRRHSQPDGAAEPVHLGHGLRGLISHEPHGWYTPVPPPSLSSFYHCWQWSNYS